MSPAELQSEHNVTCCEDNDRCVVGISNSAPCVKGNRHDGYQFYGTPLSRAEPDKALLEFYGKKYPSLTVVNGHTLVVGYGYDNDTISTAFCVSSYPRGIKIRHNKAVLFSFDDSVYQDSLGWEKDTDGEYIFVYTGEGLSGDQKLIRGNLFISNAVDGGLYLFVRNRPNDYTFYGEVELKRKEVTIEPDKNGNARKVFKFILRRHSLE